MLGWWLGKPVEGGRTGVDDERDPPETPAPVFAARALKSAIFGTPAPPDDDTAFQDDMETATTPGQGPRRFSGQMSPTKPPGILLTPGTATSRRKTVSFGHEVVDNEGKVASEKRLRRNELASDGSRKAEHSTRPARKTTLTKALENARDAKATRDAEEKPRNSSESKPLLDDTNNQDQQPSRNSQSSRNEDELVTRDDYDGDVTMDLNEPHSQSGRYWKSEFENYHEEAKEEMKKLLRYKHMAKTFAKKKDEENTDLSEKLKEEQRRVISMEDKLVKLSARIARAGANGQEDDSPELIKELAKQTALALQYKRQVEEFRAALEGDQTHRIKGQVATKERSRRHREKSNEPQAEGQGFSQGTDDAVALQEEIQRLKQSLSTVEAANQKLQGENAKVTQELLHADLRLERCVEKYEKHRKSFEDAREKKEASMQELQRSYDDLKERAKSQRRDAEELLKKRHEQAVEYKKEIASLRGLDAVAKELQETLQKKTTEHSRVVADFEIQIAELKRDVILGSDSALDLRASIQQDPALSGSLSKHRASIESPRDRESQIPVATQTISRPSKSVAPSRHARSETPSGSPGPRQPYFALSEIVNNATPNTLPPPRTGPVQFTPMVNNFSNLFIQSPGLHLPSSEPSFSPVPSRKIHEKTCHASPRPKMINIPSSPPKPVTVRQNPSGKARSNYNDEGGHYEANMASSRMSNMEDSRTKRTMPPERVAAARARLNQKLADKKRAAQGAGKENARN